MEFTGMLGIVTQAFNPRTGEAVSDRRMSVSYRTIRTAFLNPVSNNNKQKIYTGDVMQK